jgi:hypothetical protein
MRRLQAGHAVKFSRLNELPPEAAADAEFFRRIGTKSNLTMPMAVGGRVVGAIAIACFRHERTWPDDLVARLGSWQTSSPPSRQARPKQFEEARRARRDRAIGDGRDPRSRRSAGPLFNAAAERLFACSASRAIGVPIDRFIPSASARRIGTHRALPLTGDTRRMGKTTA